MIIAIEKRPRVNPCQQDYIMAKQWQSLQTCLPYTSHDRKKNSYNSPI
jgi:hypothetical protein